MRVVMDDLSPYKGLKVPKIEIIDLILIAFHTQVLHMRARHFSLNAIFMKIRVEINRMLH